MSEDSQLPRDHAWQPIYRGLYRFVAAAMFLYGALALSIVASFLHAAATNHFVFYDNELFRSFVPWFAAHVLRMRGPVAVTLNSDTPFQWVEQVVLLAIAVLAAIVWSAADRRSLNYRVLDRWLRLWVRLGLSAILFAYGFDKVFPNQFHSITRYDLIRQLGDMSHFELMWRFMAASPGYTIFSGVLEVVAGILLLVPQLATVGAFLAIAVLSNVLALNLAYNVGVKLLSTDFLFMAFYLAAQELPRLFQLLVRNRTVAPHPFTALSTNRRVSRGAVVAQAVLGFIFFIAFFYSESHRYAATREAASLPVPMQGIWLVDDFTVAGGSQASLFTPKLLRSMNIRPQEQRWSKIVFDAPGEMLIQTVGGDLDWVGLKFSAKDEALLTDSGDPAWKSDLKLQQASPGALQMQGLVNGVSVAATLHRVDESRFQVREEKFRWVEQ